MVYEAKRRSEAIVRRVHHDLAVPIMALEVLVNQANGLNEKQRNVMATALARLREISDYVKTARMQEKEEEAAE